MSVSNVNNVSVSANSNVNAYKKNLQANVAATATEDEAGKSASKANSDTFVKSNEHRMDVDKVNAMRASLSQNVSAFKQMVQTLFGNQAITSWEAIGDALRGGLVEVDEATRLEAQEAISEDGFWGVEQTAARILDFAKALTGGDPSKIDLMRNAVKAGFEAAMGAWGGQLPDISQQTLDRVMEGFREWESPTTANTTS